MRALPALQPPSAGFWRWLAACLLAWLTALALAGVARLIWPGERPSAREAAVRIESAALPVVPASRPGAVSEASIPLTDLPLEVAGRALSAVPELSLVVLTTSDGQRAVMPGDNLEPDVRVARIDAEGVVLSRQGRLERLPWPAPDDTDDTAVTPAAPTPSSPTLTPEPSP